MLTVFRESDTLCELTVKWFLVVLVRDVAVIFMASTFKKINKKHMVTLESKVESKAYRKTFSNKFNKIQKTKQVDRRKQSTVSFGDD